MHKPVRVLALLAACSPVTGCAALCVRVFGVPEPQCVRATADTPLGAVDRLVEAFRNHAPAAIYESLHADYRNSLVEGGFSMNEFAAAFEHYRTDFDADAELLAGARREGPVAVGDGLMSVRLEAGDASVVLVFRNVPTARVYVDDPDFPGGIHGPIPVLADMVTVKDDALVVTRPIPLRGQGGFLDASSITRVELYQQWLLYDVQQPRNIRFVDRLREDVKGDVR